MGSSLLRLVIGIPLAIAVTVGVFWLMIINIRVGDLDLDEEATQYDIVINQEVAEVDVRRRETTIDDVESVEPPPPPPQIERQRAEQPTEGLSTIIGEIPTFDTPSLNSDSISFSVSDRDAQPLVRIEPQYPPRAAERGIQGSCAVQFDVTPDGTPTNIIIMPGRCDSSLFERAAIRAVERWRYQPRVEDGVAVARRGVQTSFEFQLAD